MISNKITPRELWARQQISGLDVDYDCWNRQRVSIQEFARMSQSCIFTVDVFEERYDFASENFSCFFGYDPKGIRTIRTQGDLLEDRFHPDDRDQLMDFQIEHGQFIYSLSPGCRNDYRQIFQFRVLNSRQEYVNVTSRHQVIQKDKRGKAWIVMGVMDISSDQTPCDRVKRTVVNRHTGEIVVSSFIPADCRLTGREKEILLLIRQGFLSKEIAGKLNLSIHTVNNHRKNILAKLEADNVVEALYKAREGGVIC